jgi:hypothetical protein
MVKLILVVVSNVPSAETVILLTALTCKSPFLKSTNLWALVPLLPAKAVESMLVG